MPSNMRMMQSSLQHLSLLLWAAERFSKAGALPGLVGGGHGGRRQYGIAMQAIPGAL